MTISRSDDQLVAVDAHLGGMRRFELDGAGRVTAVNGMESIERYRYDAAGNLVEAQSPGDPDTRGPREFAGTLAKSAGNMRYQYDPQGRLVLQQKKRLSAKPATWRFAWNSEDRLTQVVTPDGTVWRYRYDALGRRIAKQRLAPDRNGIVEQVDFTWDGSVLVEQVHSAGHATTWEWMPGGVRVVSQTERVPAADAPQGWVDREFYGIVTDLVGTPTELVDSAGNLAGRIEHSLWGEAIARLTGVASTPLRFPGQYHDLETGFNYNFHRYYVPEIARYASQDPLGLAPAMNPQAYVPNPLSWLDPFGLAACRACDDASNAARNADQKDPLPKGDNRWFDRRREAFNAARDRAGIPRSAQPVRQWEVGADSRQMQARAADELRTRLTSFRSMAFAQWDELPDWIRAELAKTRRSTAEPDAVLPEHADEGEIRAWIESFIRDSGTGRRFYLLTGIDSLPWLECEIQDENWVHNLVEVKGHSPTIVSHDKNVLVVFYAEEYVYQAFRATPTHLRDFTGKIIPTGS